jgi:hypothetical protein
MCMTLTLLQNNICLKPARKNLNSMHKVCTIYAGLTRTRQATRIGGPARPPGRSSSQLERHGRSFECGLWCQTRPFTPLRLRLHEPPGAVPVTGSLGTPAGRRAQARARAPAWHGDRPQAGESRFRADSLGSTAQRKSIPATDSGFQVTSKLDSARLRLRHRHGD